MILLALLHSQNLLKINPYRATLLMEHAEINAKSIEMIGLLKYKSSRKGSS